MIIDTDPGVDDAMAVLLALNLPELKVEALSVVPGNVDGGQGLENALKLVSLAGQCDITVAGGAQHLHPSEVDHGAVLAGQERTGQSRVANIKVQSRLAIRPASDH